MERQRYYSCSSRRRRFLRPVTPRLVYLSSKLGTRTNDDSEVRRLRSRESRELLKSNESNTLSHFFRVERLGEGTRIQISQNPQVFTRLMCANPPSLFFSPVRLVVRTHGFHPCNRSSILLQGTTFEVMAF